MAQVGIIGNLMEWYGANPTFNQVTILNTGRNLKEWHDFDDFVGGFGQTGQTRGIYNSLNAGAGALVFDGAPLSTRPGILVLGTGTTNAGYATLYSGRAQYTSFLFGGGVYTWEGDIRIPTLSTALEEYIIKIGFGDVLTGADFVDGAYFIYDRTVNVNWLRGTASNSARTATDSGVAVAAAAWTRLKIVVNAAGTSVEFFINGVSVGANIANIPTGAGRELAVVGNIIKSVGTTDRSFWWDWSWVHIDLAVSR